VEYRVVCRMEFAHVFLARSTARRRIPFLPQKFRWECAGIRWPERGKRVQRLPPNAPLAVEEAALAVRACSEARGRPWLTASMGRRVRYSGSGTSAASSMMSSDSAENPRWCCDTCRKRDQPRVVRE
jgi:hypothetical protein